MHKSKDFRIFKSSENNESSLYNKRKLEFEIPKNEEKYQTRSSRHEYHVNRTISQYVFYTDTLVNKLYYAVKEIEKRFKFDYFIGNMNRIRENLIFESLPYVKRLFEKESEYYLLEDRIMKSLNKVTNFFSDKLNLLTENRNRIIDTLKDKYLFLSSIKNYLPNYILGYYRMLNQIISLKTVSYTKKEKYNVDFDTKTLMEDFKRNKEMLERAAKKRNAYLNCVEEGTKKNEENEPPDYDDVLDEDFGYGDVDEDGGQFASGFIPYPDELDDGDDDDDNESKLDKWGKALEKRKISFETEIAFEFKNWSNFEMKIKNNAAKEWGWDGHMSAQFPIIFPALPQLQFRCGIKFEISVKLKVGVEFAVNIKIEDAVLKPSIDLGLLIDFSFNMKVVIFAEVGYYGAVVSVKGGIEGTIADVRAGFKLSFNFLKFYSDFYIYLKFYAWLFRIYVESEIDIKIWKLKARFVDIPFGLDEPLFE